MFSNLAGATELKAFSLEKASSPVLDYDNIDEERLAFDGNGGMQLRRSDTRITESLM